MPFLNAMSLLGDLMVGNTPKDAEHLRYHRFEWLEIDVPEGMQFNLDGEPRQGTAFRFDVKPRAVPFLLPPNSPAASGAE